MSTESSSMDKSFFKLCLIAPSLPASDDLFRKVLRLLNRAEEQLDLVVVDRDGNSVSDKAGSIIPGQGFPGKASSPDLFMCWDLSAVGEILAMEADIPMVYGLSHDGLQQGFLPVHARIGGYFSDVSFVRPILTSCGIPLERHFNLTAGVDTGEYPPPKRNGSNKGNRILVIGDDPALISAVQAACGLLGLRLERLPASAVAKGMPADLLARYDCVIASGQRALDAAASGMTVIVADERGSAGVLTRDKLERVLEAHAGPACFDSTASIEVFLNALHAYRASDAAGLAGELCALHDESARARRWVGWLREVGACAKTRAVSGREGAARWPQLLNIAAMVAASARRDEARAGEWALPAEGGSVPACELLVDLPPSEPNVSAPPSLPLDQYIPTSDGTVPAGFFGEGWSYGEPWGRWTEAQEAVLLFRPEPFEGGLKLLFHLHGFLPAGRLFQRVLVRVNGHPVLCWKVDCEARAAPFELPLWREHLVEGEECRITFYLPDIDTPSAWGGVDTRKLGLALVGLKLIKE
jgi:hypothetical protein